MDAVNHNRLASQRVQGNDTTGITWQDNRLYDSDTQDKLDLHLSFNPQRKHRFEMCLRSDTRSMLPPKSENRGQLSEVQYEGQATVDIKLIRCIVSSKSDKILTASNI